MNGQLLGKIRADPRYLSVALLLLASCSADPPLAYEARSLVQHRFLRGA